MARPLYLLTVPAVVFAAGLLGLAAVRANRTPVAIQNYAPLVRASVSTRERVTTPRTLPEPTPAPAPTPAPTPPPPAVSVNTILVGGLNRQWEQISPGGGTTSSTPILMVLHGQAANVAYEVQRDGLVPLVADGHAELVYPQGIGNSWNAAGCCGPAATQNVDDVGFLQELVQVVDPGHLRPIYLVGYSNGGRLTYTVACDDPSLVTGFAVVDAVPLAGCTLTRPITVLQVDGSADPDISYLPGQPETENGEPATTLASQLRALDGCAPAPVNVQTGTLTTASYTGCAGGVRFVFATYQGANHDWPEGTATTPSAGRTIWAFVGQGQPW